MECTDDIRKEIDQEFAKQKAELNLDANFLEKKKSGRRTKLDRLYKAIEKRKVSS